MAAEEVLGNLQEIKNVSSLHEFRLGQIESQRLPKTLNDISNKMISDKVRELINPIKIKQSLENKELKSIFDDLSKFIKTKVSLIEDTA